MRMTNNSKGKRSAKSGKNKSGRTIACSAEVLHAPGIICAGDGDKMRDDAMKITASKSGGNLWPG